MDGQWRQVSKSETFAVHDPGTEEVFAEVADGQADNAAAALDAAAGAQPEWAATPVRERGEILRRAWQLMTDRVDDLALVMTLEMGKSLPESRRRWFMPRSSSVGSPRKRHASTVTSTATRVNGHERMATMK